MQMINIIICKFEGLMNIINQQLKQDHALAFAQLLDSFNKASFRLEEIDLVYLHKLCLSSIYAAEKISLSPKIYMQWKTRQNKPFEISHIELDKDDLVFDEKSIKQYLREKRHQCLIQIILNDVCLNQPVADILKQISELAEKLIQTALVAATTLLSDKHGMPLDNEGNPQQLIVLAMGKLGGGELNFSSDVDIIYLYANDGELSGVGSLSYREFYSRVARLFTKLLNDVTEHGFVYRVDLRLRPWGDSGPVVINLAGLENYYQRHGRDWERYALVKAKALTGSEADKQALQDIITPFVYRKYHDFNVFSGLGSLKQQIDHEAKKKSRQLNIKLCSGGIREIEFCIQALQILQGGRNKKLQESSILKMFELAQNDSFYSDNELADLQSSYLLFRLVENRIQMMQDQQTHLLPLDDVKQERLLISLEINSWHDLMQQLSLAQATVNKIFTQLFLEINTADVEIDFESYDLNEWSEYCDKIGLEQVQTAAKHLQLFFKERIVLLMSKKGKQRLNELLPCLLEHISTYENSQELLDLLINLLLSIARRSVYLEMMFMHQPLLKKLIHLFAKSKWLAEEVIRFPILLESVLIADENYIFDKERLAQLLLKELKQVEGDVELELDILRVFKRQQVFQIALNEIEGKISPLTASAYLSDLAALLLQASYELNIKLLIQQYGQPQYELKGECFDAGFAVVAYGKLGGRELHYNSDLDVIFLHDSQGTKQQTNGKKTIDNVQFFGRLAQKITASMSLMTSSGRLYEIDARLRPNGASGFLVSSLSSYQTYQTEKAWVWEHQALVRASYVAGERKLDVLFSQIKCSILSHITTRHVLSSEIADMREKMLRATQSNNNKNLGFNIKNSRGGMIDIEFIVQYFVLLNANKLPSLCAYSDNIGLIEHLQENHCLNQDFSVLTSLYQSLHHYLHQQVLQQNYVLDMDEQVIEQIASVKQLWQHVFTANIRD